MTEIEKLRAEVRSIETVQKMCGKELGAGSDMLIDLIINRKQKIAQLEAEADPWQDAKQTVHWWYELNPCREATVAFYVRHLESENAAKDARIAELEARDMPPLDPARVKRTSLEVGYISGDSIMNAEPYPLAEPKK